MRREATISADGLYRHDLTREVQPGCGCWRCVEHYARQERKQRPGFVLFALCNPSTANGEEDDATERRGWGFTNAWGFGKFIFVNANPFRSTDPKKAQHPSSTALATNDLYLMTHAREAALVVCAWGANANAFYANRAKTILQAWAPLHYLALTKNGIPKHPLYLRGDLVPQPWNT